MCFPHLNASSSRIVPVPVPWTIVALLGLLRTTVKVSVSPSEIGVVGDVGVIDFEISPAARSASCRRIETIVVIVREQRTPGIAV